MIPELYIRDWKKQALWQTNEQVDSLLYCCKIYYEHAELKQPTAKQFIRNMEEKLTDFEFTNDIFTVLKPNVVYNTIEAWELVRNKLIEIKPETIKNNEINKKHI